MKRTSYTNTSDRNNAESHLLILISLSIGVVKLRMTIANNVNLFSIYYNWNLYVLTTFLRVTERPLILKEMRIDLRV
jgi:hypothetical protein